LGRRAQEGQHPARRIAVGRRDTPAGREGSGRIIPVLPGEDGPDGLIPAGQAIAGHLRVTGVIVPGRGILLERCRARAGPVLRPTSPGGEGVRWVVAALAARGCPGRESWGSDGRPIPRRGDRRRTPGTARGEGVGQGIANPRRAWRRSRGGRGAVVVHPQPPQQQGHFGPVLAGRHRQGEQGQVVMASVPGAEVAEECRELADGGGRVGARHIATLRASGAARQGGQHAQEPDPHPSYAAAHVALTFGNTERVTPEQPRQGAGHPYTWRAEEVAAREGLLPCALTLGAAANRGREVGEPDGLSGGHDGSLHWWCPGRKPYGRVSILFVKVEFEQMRCRAGAIEQSAAVLVPEGLGIFVLTETGEIAPRARITARR
jgi:hypothetical protein